MHQQNHLQHTDKNHKHNDDYRHELDHRLATLSSPEFSVPLHVHALKDQGPIDRMRARRVNSHIPEPHTEPVLQIAEAWRGMLKIVPGTRVWKQ
jgi:hypothetical protein